MYRQLPTLTVSLASRLSDRQDATFLTLLIHPKFKKKKIQLLSSTCQWLTKKSHCSLPTFAVLQCFSHVWWEDQPQKLSVRHNCYIYVYIFMSVSDPVTHNQIHHIHNLTPLVTNTRFELLLKATWCDSLIITLLCTNHWLNCVSVLPLSTLTQIYNNCAALKDFGADPPTRHD